MAVHVRDTGKGRPVLLLHGFMGSGGDWRGVVEALQPARRCLAVDLPGHGGSAAMPDAAFTMAGAAHELLAVLEERQIARCDVIGYSMGGRLALFLAMHHPERVRRLVLEAASPGLATAEARAARRALDEERARRLEAEDFGAFLADWYRMPLFASLHAQPGLVEKMTAARRRNDPHALARVLRGLGTGRQPSLWERLGGFPVATLALAGALDAKYVGIARQMAAAGPCVRAAVVPGAGHNVHAEQPRRFLRLIRPFLKPDS